jgi:succinate dehydrogenase/fumarate reductase cytochrome b subunit
MIKKWNAVCSWMLTLFLLGHMLTMSIPMLTGGQDYSDCQILAEGIMATVLIHVVLCIVSYYPRRGILNFHRYRKANWRLITQRISGIVILILLYPHMRVLHLIISGASFSGGAKFLVLVTEILFAGAAFLHLSVSFSRSMLTLGLLKNDRMEKLVDYVTWIICGLLMVLTVAARIRL